MRCAWPSCNRTWESFDAAAIYRHVSRHVEYYEHGCSCSKKFVCTDDLNVHLKGSPAACHTALFGQYSSPYLSSVVGMIVNDIRESELEGSFNYSAKNLQDWVQNRNALSQGRESNISASRSITNIKRHSSPIASGWDHKRSRNYYDDDYAHHTRASASKERCLLRRHTSPPQRSSSVLVSRNDHNEFVSRLPQSYDIRDPSHSQEHDLDVVTVGTQNSSEIILHDHDDPDEVMILSDSSDIQEVPVVSSSAESSKKSGADTSDQPKNRRGRSKIPCHPSTETETGRPSNAETTLPPDATFSNSPLKDGISVQPETRRGRLRSSTRTLKPFSDQVEPDSNSTDVPLPPELSKTPSNDDTNPPKRRRGTTRTCKNPSQRDEPLTLKPYFNYAASASPLESSKTPSNESSDSDSNSDCVMSARPGTSGNETFPYVRGLRYKRVYTQADGQTHEDDTPPSSGDEFRKLLYEVNTAAKQGKGTKDSETASAETSGVQRDITSNEFEPIIVANISSYSAPGRRTSVECEICEEPVHSDFEFRYTHVVDKHMEGHSESDENYNDELGNKLRCAFPSLDWDESCCIMCKDRLKKSVRFAHSRECHLKETMQCQFTPNCLFSSKLIADVKNHLEKIHNVDLTSGPAKQCFVKCKRLFNQKLKVVRNICFPVDKILHDKRRSIRMKRGFSDDMRTIADILRADTRCLEENLTEIDVLRDAEDDYEEEIIIVHENIQEASDHEGEEGAGDENPNGERTTVEATTADTSFDPAIKKEEVPDSQDQEENPATITA